MIKLKSNVWYSDDDASWSIMNPKYAKIISFDEFLKIFNQKIRRKLNDQSISVITISVWKIH